MYLEFLLSLTFLALCILYFLQNIFVNHSNLFGQKESPNEVKTRKVERFKYFFVAVPLFDGLYSIYLIRKLGIHLANQWSSKMEPNGIYVIPIGHLSVIFSRDASIVQKLLYSSDPGHLSRPKFFYHHLFAGVLSNGLFGSPVEVWTHQRKIISRAFTFRAFQRYTESMNKHSKNLAIRLSQLVREDGGEISGQKLFDCIHSNTLRITLEFIMGSEISESEDAIQLADDFWEYKETVVSCLISLEFYIPLIWRFHPKRKRFEVVTKSVRELSRKIIELYQEKRDCDSDYDYDNDEGKDNANKLHNGIGNVKRCLIGEMLKHNASPEEILSEIGTFLIAGHETILGAINVLLHHLACHPEYQARCRDEVDNAMGPYKSKSIFDEDDLSVENLSKLEYLERFILESQRITPSVPLIARELKSPLKIDENLTLNEGSIVAVASWILHHDPLNYPDPDRFDPDRFLPEEVAKRSPGTYVPFSAGQRNCIGKKFAMIEMKTILAWILRYFEIETEDGLHEVKLFFEATVKPERMYRTTLKMRKLPEIALD